jgi:putative transposase
MSRCFRPRLPGVPIFFTVALAQQGGRVLVDQVEVLRDAVRATRGERPFGIDAWVVLPDHLHCIWRLPDGDCDYSVRWRLIKARFSRAMLMGPLRDSQRARQERGIWQRRFWEHHVRDNEDHAANIRYCWFNPVKHGLVERPEDWPYSSFHRDKAAGKVA